MGIRDEDLKKLLQYAKAVGIKVIFKPHKKGDWTGAGWDFSDEACPLIYINTWPRQSKINLVLSLLHELGHHLDWIHSNKKISKLERTAHELETSRKPGDPPIPKKYREAIYKSELRGYQYQLDIAKETQIKVKPEKIFKEIDEDENFYKHYKDTGELDLNTSKRKSK